MQTTRTHFSIKRILVERETLIWAIFHIRQVSRVIRVDNLKHEILHFRFFFYNTYRNKILMCEICFEM